MYWFHCQKTFFKNRWKKRKGNIHHLIYSVLINSYSSDTDSYSESVSDLESDSYSSSSSSDGRHQKKRSRKGEGHRVRKNKDKREIGGGQRSKKSRHHSRWPVFSYKLFILFVLFAHLSLIESF